jgi:hypothetical protein
MYNLLVKLIGWWYNEDHYRLTMPLKMIYDINTKRDCLFPSPEWKRVMDGWPLMKSGDIYTMCYYPDFRDAIYVLRRKKPDCIENIRYEQEYTFRDAPYSMVTRDPMRKVNDVIEDEEEPRMKGPIMIQKVEAIMEDGEVIMWDTARFLRYAGPRSDFHNVKDIRMRDLFDANEEVPDEWHVYMFGKKIVIKKDDELTPRTLVPGRT